MPPSPTINFQSEVTLARLETPVTRSRPVLWVASAAYVAYVLELPLT